MNTISRSSHYLRNTIWRDILSGGFHVSWEPFMVDCALNCADEIGASSLKEVLDSNEFEKAIQRKADKIGLYEDLVPSEIYFSKDGAMLFNFISHVAVSRSENFSLVDMEDVRSVIMETYMVKADKFIPSTQSNKAFISFGFEAFFWNVIWPTARNNIIKLNGLPNCIPIDENLCEPELLKNEDYQEEFGIKEIYLKAAAFVLKEEKTRNKMIFLLHFENGLGVEEISSKIGISKSAVHKVITAISSNILDELKLNISKSKKTLEMFDFLGK